MSRPLEASLRRGPLQPRLPDHQTPSRIPRRASKEVAAPDEEDLPGKNRILPIHVKKSAPNSASEKKYLTPSRSRKPALTVPPFGRQDHIEHPLESQTQSFAIGGTLPYASMRKNV